MKRTHLGEFEELVLLMVIIQDGDAYGVSVKQALEKEANRAVNISAVHSALRRLEEKGFVKSGWSAATTERGGRRKRVFLISPSGRRALEQARDTKVKLWTQIPDFSPKMIRL